MFDWNDIHIFLTVAREGSALAAAERLGMNQSTVTRRMRSFETALDLTLFERDTRGTGLAPHGTALLDVAGQMGAAAENVALRAERLHRELSGTIRVTAAAEVMVNLAAPAIAAFCRQHTDIRIEAETGESQVDLERGEADVAIRAADIITGDTLIARRTVEIEWAIYCSKDYQSTNGAPCDLEDCRLHRFVQFSPAMRSRVAFLGWLSAQIDDDRIGYTVNSVPAMIASLRTGFGVGAMPRITGDSQPDLIRCFAHDRMKHPLWIVASQRAYSEPRVRAFMKFMAEHFREFFSPTR